MYVQIGDWCSWTTLMTFRSFVCPGVTCVPALMLRSLLSLLFRAEIWVCMCLCQRCMYLHATLYPRVEWISSCYMPKNEGCYKKRVVRDLSSFLRLYHFLLLVLLLPVSLLVTLSYLALCCLCLSQCVCSSDPDHSRVTFLSHPKLRLAYWLATLVGSLIRLPPSSHAGLQSHEYIIAPLANKCTAESFQMRELVHRIQYCLLLLSLLLASL